MSETITIVGSSARAAAFSAARAGYRVHTADLFCDRDLEHVSTATRAADYPAGLARTIRGSQPGSWMYVGALENEPALIDAWSRDRQLLGNSGDILRAVRDPHAVSCALRDAELLAPEVRSTASRLPADGTWLQKPFRSAGGNDIERWHGGPGIEVPHYFQQRIEGESYAAVYLGAEGRAVLWGVTQQWIGEVWTGANGYRYCGSIGPSALDDRASREIAAIGEVLAQAFSLRGLFGVDVVVNDQGVWPVEINPRYTASVEVLERASGASAIAAHVAACTSGTLLPIPAKAGRIAGKAVLFATRGFIIPGEFDALADLEIVAPSPQMADLPRAGDSIEAGWPILTLLASGQDEQQVVDELRARAKMLRELFKN